MKNSIQKFTHQLDITEYIYQSINIDHKDILNFEDIDYDTLQDINIFVANNLQYLFLRHPSPLYLLLTEYNIELWQSKTSSNIIDINKYTDIQDIAEILCEIIYNLISSLKCKFKKLKNKFEDNDDIEDQSSKFKLNIYNQNIAKCKPLLRTIKKLHNFLQQYEENVTNNHSRINSLIYELDLLMQDINSYSNDIQQLINIESNNINMELNHIMKTLTAIAAIFIPLTFLTSIYGMNFSNMPETQYIYAYPVFLGIIFAVGISVFVILKFKKWL